MPTRLQNAEHAVFRQEAFASSPDFERGLLGNLVAARCQRLTDRAEVAMLWWLQQISWRDGGLERFAREFLEANRDRIGTPSMFEFGKKDGQIYTAAQVRKVRAEMPSHGSLCFPLKGEIEDPDPLLDPVAYDDIAGRIAARAKAGEQPSSYPARSFITECFLSDDRFVDILKHSLVDPVSKCLRAGLWNFPALWDALCAWRNREIDAACSSIVETEVSARVFETLDFARESRSFVLIEGREGLGKSESARNWCRRHPGESVYVSLQSGTDEMTLFRCIAQALGTACAITRKAGEIKANVEKALQPGHLTLVLDEAHFLWPQSGRAERSAPKRVDWLRTALIDNGVPVAIISTPQYFANQCNRFRQGGWNASQIQRRLAHTERLPEKLSLADMQAVIRLHFPEIQKTQVLDIAILATGSLGFVGAIGHLRKRLDFLVSRKGARSEAETLDRLIAELATEAGIDLDALKAEATKKPAPAPAMQTPGSRVALPVPRRCTAPANLSRISSEQPMLSVT
jgi:hypothetical protein